MGVFSDIFRSLTGVRGNFFDMGYNLWSINPQFNTYADDVQKRVIVLQNPAMLKVVSLQCDLFSMGKWYHYRDGEDIGETAYTRLLNKPNFLQSKNQFLWDYMFWKMIGNAYLYVDSRTNVSPTNKLYFLDPSKLDFPTKLQDAADHLILSQATFNELNRLIVKYKYNIGKEIPIPLEKIRVFTDLTNGTGNWWKGSSKIEALYKIISNSESGLDAKKINVDFSGKFLVAGKSEMSDVSKMPLGNEEKNDIETKMNGKKQVHAVKSMIDIKRFVENLKNMELSKSYLDDFYLIGNMYGIPRDVLEAFNEKGATYENQEKSTGRHVAYCMEPAGEDFGNALHDYWRMPDNESLVLSWDHLPFVQVFEKDRQEVFSTKIANFEKLVRMGMTVDEANRFLDTDFEDFELKGNGNDQTGIGTENQGDEEPEDETDIEGEIEETE